ncbi:MAG TPA: dihydrolipoamide acetyltransferase family protein [Anaeromyxobacter sp.]|nr:dihydrolipoamide acetyltransferase family protein [Anaeromyxobacter sp.]
MAKPIKMPKLSDQMTEGKIAEWMKKEGDEVKAGDVVAQVETEKATLDVEAFESGVLLGVVVRAGESAPVGQPIAWLGARGEKVPAAEAGAAKGDAAKQEKAGGEVAHVSTQPAPPAETKEARPEASGAPERKPQPAPARKLQRAPEPRPAPASPPPSRGARQAPAQAAFREANPAGRVIASPAARKRARERGIDIAGVEGSGPRGRVVLADLERAPAQRAEPGRRAQPAGAPAPAPAGKKRRPLPPRVELRDETVPLTPMRKAIARNLAVSKPGAPHYYLEISVDMRRMVALREQLEELDEGPVSFNDLVVKAAADALSRHPEVNAAWGADAIVHRGSVDIGVAVAIEEGLITPVVRDADAKTVFEIAAEIRELAGRAREKRLEPDEYQGASFTISNLGMFGIEAFYAVINPPEAAILAVGTVQKVPWIDDATGQVVAMERMRLGLSGDHRVIDGAAGARFLQTLKAILESPVRLVVP